MAAEIEVSFRTGPGEDDVDGPYVRRVLLPLRPIDLEAQLAAAGAQQLGNGLPGDEDADGIPDEEDPVDNDGDDGPGPEADDDQSADEEGGKTVQACLAAHPELQQLLDAATVGSPGLASAIESLLGQPASVVAGLVPVQIPADCL
jgi:hypothetical protein